MVVSGLRSYRVEPSSFEAGTDPERAQAPVSEGPPAPPCATFGHPDQVTLSIVYKRSKKSHPAVSAALLCPGILSIWKPDSMQKCDRRSNFLDNLSVTFFGTRFSHDNRSASIQNCESRDCHTPRSHEGVCMSVCVCGVFANHQGFAACMLSAAEACRKTAGLPQQLDGETKILLCVPAWAVQCRGVIATAADMTVWDLSWADRGDGRRSE